MTIYLRSWSLSTLRGSDEGPDIRQPAIDLSILFARALHFFVELSNYLSDAGRARELSLHDATQAHHQAEEAIGDNRRLKEALDKVVSDYKEKLQEALAKVVEADTKVAKVEREAEASMWKAEKRATKVEYRTEDGLAEACRLVIEAFRALEDFMWEQVSVIEEYRILKEFYKKKMAFNQDTYETRYRVGFDDCQGRVAARLPEANLSFLDKEE
ncbi:hypothetical protein COCNU_14G011210 [Cocos nucifera]|uniref:Uncharacterized protein n=1 Tax=Cocos nucifera TaxID=13894 RepID=A0A8K0NCU1_COCNU|nr:hypothetical protein COCNU_14G011210 [Cocos nucifera]